MVDKENRLNYLCKEKLFMFEWKKKKKLLKTFETTKENENTKRIGLLAALRWEFYKIVIVLAAYNENGNDFSDWLKTFQTEVNVLWVPFDSKTPINRLFSCSNDCYQIVWLKMM